MRYLIVLILLPTIVWAQDKISPGTTSPITTWQGGCVLATVAPDDVVTFDWDCVEKASRGEAGEYMRQMALILKAARKQ